MINNNDPLVIKYLEHFNVVKLSIFNTSLIEFFEIDFLFLLPIVHNIVMDFSSPMEGLIDAQDLLNPMFDPSKLELEYSSKRLIFSFNRIKKSS